MASVRVKTELTSPPGGWRCHVPESGKRIEGEHFSELEKEVAGHLRDIQADPTKASELIHETTGRVLVAGGHADLVEQVSRSKRKPLDYAAGAIAKFKVSWRKSPAYRFLSNYIDGHKDPFVDQAEAERRANICAECEENGIPAGKGWLEGWTDGVMLDSVMGKTVEKQDELGTCDACNGCELRAVVWWAPDILVEVSRFSSEFLRRAPAHCWKRNLLSPA